MQNLIVFCQRCFTWVETHSDICPECAAEVPLDEPDPNREALDDLIGKPVGVLGPLRIEGHSLPNYGFFIGTTAGLLFLPRLHRRVNGAWEAVSSQRLPRWWPFRGDLTSPRFLSWLRRPFGNLTAVEPKSEELPEQEIGPLVDRLIESPGAFFVEHRLIKAVTGRRRLVKLDRPPARSVTMVDETDDGSLCFSLNALISQVGREQLRPAL